MKTQTFAVLLLSVSGLVTTYSAQAELVHTEVAVARVFVPATGYDDNDPVQIVLNGELPNGCYSLEKTTWERTANTNQIVVHQFALKNVDGVCANEANLPDRIRPASPFTTNVSVGVLAQGSYSVVFSPNLPSTQTRSFVVENAPVATIDSLPYASVDSVQIPGVVSTGARIEISLAGTLANSCVSLNDNIEVRIVGDVIVLLPTVNVHSGACLMYTRPFYKQVFVDALPVGNYLVQVRSRNGQSPHQAFVVRAAESSSR